MNKLIIIIFFFLLIGCDNSNPISNSDKNAKEKKTAILYFYLSEPRTIRFDSSEYKIDADYLIYYNNGEIIPFPNAKRWIYKQIIY